MSKPVYTLNISEPLTQAFYKLSAKEYIDHETVQCGHRIQRLRIGSDFCPVFFRKTLEEGIFNEMFKHAERSKLPITICVPVLNQNNLECSKKLLRKALEEPSVNEVTVNDFGMLDELLLNSTYKKVNINLGRLFFKNLRDARYSESEQEGSGYPDITEVREVLEKHGDVITGIELDPVPGILTDLHRGGLKDINVALHQPYCFQITGNICMFASTFKNPKNQFRPNMECCMECSLGSEIYDIPDNEYIHAGRTVYFKHIDPHASKKREYDRIVWRELP